MKRRSKVPGVKVKALRLRLLECARVLCRVLTAPIGGCTCRACGCG